MTTRFSVVSDYNQVHLLDEGGGGSLENGWSLDDVDARITAASGIVGLNTARNEEVHFDVDVLEAAPTSLDDTAQHVTEATLRVRSGVLVVVGCTEYVPEAPRVELAPGSWRVRASHRGLDIGPEVIRLQLWRARATKPKVLKQWVPPPRPSAKRRSKARAAQTETQAAAALARAGLIDDALPRLLARAKDGDAVASAGLSECAAYRGDWPTVVEQSVVVLAQPSAFPSADTFVEHARLLRRAARELGDEQVVTRAAQLVPAAYVGQRDAVLLREFAPPELSGPEPESRFEQALQAARAHGRFRGHPSELALHEFALAAALGADEAVAERWREADARLGWPQALAAAQAFVRRGQLAEAWSAVWSRVPVWVPLHLGSVAPLTLLYDPWVASVMTSERCELILKTRRAVTLE